jgi:hypothetical protein
MHSNPKILKMILICAMSDIDNPTYEVYQDDDDGIYTPVPDIDKGDPNTFDRNIGAEVKLSIGTKS